MMNRLRKLFSNSIIVITCLSLVLGSLTGCQTSQTKEDVSSSELVDEIIDSLVDEASDLYNLENSKEDEFVTAENESIEDNAINAPFIFSDNWEDYMGDVETLVYGLVIEELKYYYDVFPASTRLSTGVVVSGIGYSDYSESFIDSSNNKKVFYCGFLPYCGELSISDDEFNNGLIIVDEDHYDENTILIVKYKCEPFTKHCIAYNQYIQYGINEYGGITYHSSEYQDQCWNEDYGTLYSYDEEKYILDYENRDYINLSAIPISQRIDFSELAKEVDNLFENQDKNFEKVEYTTSLEISQQVVIDYLLSLQEESFLGYSVKELIGIADSLELTETLQINPTDIQLVSRIPADSPDELVIWLLRSAHIILSATSIVGSIITAECPLLSGAFSGLGVFADEVFNQIVKENRLPKDIDWTEVITVTIIGALSGTISPFINAKFDGWNLFFIDSFVDGILAGIKQASLSWLNGERGHAIMESFGIGFAMGTAISAGIKLAAKGIEKIAPSISNIIPYPIKKKTIDLVKPIIDPITKKIVDLKAAVDKTIFHSDYIRDKLIEKQINRLIKDNTSQLFEKSANSLRNKNIYDIDGNSITKKEFIELAKKAEDGSIIGKYIIEGETVNIVKQNGMIGVYFDEKKYQTVSLDGWMLDDREKNMQEACEKLKKQWISGEKPIPPEILRAIEDSGLDLESMTAAKLLEIIQSSDMVLHENIDLHTITLVSRTIHDKCNESGIAHMGGYGLAKYLKEHISFDYFDRIIATISSWIAIGVS